MDWSNERYVRLYTRDTVDWLALSWQARALFAMLLRKIDRAGVIDLGRHGVKGLAVVVGMPVDVVAPALADLLEDGCIEQHETRLVVPNFIEAQEASQTDAQRARESRANRRDRSRVTKPDGAVTIRDAAVTPVHTTSHDVTPSVPPTPSTPSTPTEETRVSAPPKERAVESEKPVRQKCVLGRDGEGGAAWQAWCDGVRRVTDRPVSELASWEKTDIVAFANAHADGRRGEELVAWIADTAEAFARQHDPTFGGFKPKGCKQWLDSGRPAAFRPSGTRLVGGPLIQGVPPEGRLWKEGRDICAEVDRWREQAASPAEASAGAAGLLAAIGGAR